MTVKKLDKTLNAHEAARDEEFSLKTIVIKIRSWNTYLRSNLRLILLFTAIGAIIGVTYAFLKKPKYTAACTFVLDDGGSGGGGLSQYAGLASMVGIDFGGGGSGIFQGDNIIELYKSNTMIRKTLLTPVTLKGKRKLLIDRYVEVNKLRDKWQDDDRLKNLNFDNILNSTNRLRDSIINDIISDVSQNCLSITKPDKKLSIIKVDVTSKDDFFSKNFNDEIVKNVNDFYTQTKTKKSQDIVKILQQKVDSIRSVMYGAIAKAALVNDATPNINLLKQSLRQTPVQRSQFSIETSKATLSELLKNLELSKITLKRETPLIQVIDKPNYPLFKEKISKVKYSILGALCFAFLSSAYLILKKALSDLMLAD